MFQLWYGLFKKQKFYLQQPFLERSNKVSLTIISKICQREILLSSEFFTHSSAGYATIVFLRYVTIMPSEVEKHQWAQSRPAQHRVRRPHVAPEIFLSCRKCCKSPTSHNWLPLRISSTRQRNRLLRPAGEFMLINLALQDFWVVQAWRRAHKTIHHASNCSTCGVVNLVQRLWWYLHLLFFFAVVFHLYFVVLHELVGAVT